MHDEDILISASPAEAIIADSTGLAVLLQPHEISSEGGRAADRRGQLSWALFEGARDPNVLFQLYIISPFFATVMMHDALRGQELWGDTTSWGGVLTALLAPFMGAIADKGGPRKPWLAFFAAVMVVSFAGTWVGVPNSNEFQIYFVAAMIILNNIVFEFSNAFHGSMLSAVAPRSKIGSLSGLAYTLGNGSGFLLLVFFLAAFVVPEHALFDVDKVAHVPERLSGPITAIWMLVLAIPLFLFTPDRQRATLGWLAIFRQGIASVARTVSSLDDYRNIAHYLGARSLFNDGMTGVLTFTGIYAAGTFHLGVREMTMLGIELTVFAALGGLLGGWVDDRLGSRKALFISIGGTAVSFALALLQTPDRVFWFWRVDPIAAAFPLPFFTSWPELFYVVLTDMTALCIVAGYANSRAMMARLAPPEKMTEFFGLMSLSGTATTFIAPIAVSWMTYWTHSQRGGMIAVVFLLFAGLAWMFKVREERAVTV